MANSLSDSVTKVHQAAREGTADLTDLLKRLNTDERKTALETKTKDGDHITTPLIIAAHNGNLDSVKIVAESLRTPLALVQEDCIYLLF